MSKAVVPTARLYSQVPTSSILINFQTATAPVPAGVSRRWRRACRRSRGTDTYGWNVDNTAQARDRNAANSPDQRYDTLVYMQKPANPNASWSSRCPTARSRPHRRRRSILLWRHLCDYGGKHIGRERIDNECRALARGHGDRRGERRPTHLRNGAGATTNEICFARSLRHEEGNRLTLRPLMTLAARSRSRVLLGTVAVAVPLWISERRHLQWTVPADSRSASTAGWSPSPHAWGGPVWMVGVLLLVPRPRHACARTATASVVEDT